MWLCEKFTLILLSYKCIHLSLYSHLQNAYGYKYEAYTCLPMYHCIIMFVVIMKYFIVIY